MSRPGMIDHSLEVRRAVIARLKFDPAVVAIAGTKIFDDPTDADMPFVRYGLPVAEPFEASCLVGSSHRVQLHGFDKGPGTTGAMRLGKALGDAMERFTATTFEVIDLQAIRTQIIDDPDVPNAHHVIVEYLIVAAQFSPLTLAA